MPTVSLKKFEDKYVDDMVKLYLDAYKGLEVYAYKGVEDTKSYINWLKKRDREGILLAFVDNELVGFIAADSEWFSKREGEKVGAVHELVVREDHRRKGIASLLMEKALDYFKVKGLKKAELWVGDENEGAKRFYKKFGFKENGRYNYWIRMTKEL